MHLFNFWTARDAFSGMLFANNHLDGHTFIFNLRGPLQPKIVTSFADMDGHLHPNRGC
jgi:hypothetical protein